jgi:hypothetical protein
MYVTTVQKNNNYQHGSSVLMTATTTFYSLWAKDKVSFWSHTYFFEFCWIKIIHKEYSEKIVFYKNIIWFSEENSGATPTTSTTYNIK